LNLLSNGKKVLVSTCYLSCPLEIFLIRYFQVGTLRLNLDKERNYGIY